MRVLLAGGGTAGHINPALSIAGVIKKHNKDAEILFVGNKTGMEQRLVKQAGYDIKSIVVSGFYRGFKYSDIKHNAKTVMNAISSKREAKKIIEEFNPDICIGTGGYVSGPVILAASRMGIKTIIHEQNAFPGVTNIMLSKNVDKVMLANEDAIERFPKNADTIVTGNPIRQEILSITKEEARKKLGLDDKPLVLSFGGSLGAKCINESLIPLIKRSAEDKKYNHIHAYGHSGAWMIDILKEQGIDYKDYDNLDIRQYIDDMPYCLSACDIVVSRAGAITLSEIQAKGKPAVLIPSPYVAENHQYHNAMSLVRRKAALVIEEKDLTGEKLIEKVDTILKDKEVLEEYSNNAREMAITDADERIYSVIEEVL